MPRLFATLLALVLLTACTAHPTRSTDPDKPPHLAQAELFLTQLRPQDTSHQHSPSLVSFAHTRHDNAECRTDCSGFVEAILRHTYRLTDLQVRETMGNERPLAQHFHAAIEAGPAFTQIKHIQDANPGDIIAIRNPSYNRNAGHVMILAAQPRRRDPTPPLIDNTRQWDLDVIDCTDAPHSNDSRSKPNDESATGAGRGTFRIYTDKDGLIVGHTWSDSHASAYRTQDDRHLVIGRWRLGATARPRAVP
jgi:hypothetical protein